MGGAVSSGRDNNELIDNLLGGSYIRTRSVERVFRALDRADYMTPEARDEAYKDLAWRNGPLHMSAPCIYSEVVEGLELRAGLSFLNVGSGTGYLSTLVGLILGSGGISHGVEVHPVVVEYSTKKLSQFIENSPTLDDFDFCEPKYYSGNGLCLAPLASAYDRVYCGAGCPEEYQNYFKQLIKVGGILVMPLNDNLVQVRRVGEDEWVWRSLLNVSFATLRLPTKDESTELIKLEEQTPPRLQVLSRGVVRCAMRRGLLRRHPELREPPPRQPPAKKSRPRRICIPIEDDSDVEGLNALHDLDRAGGGHEMNALLSLVLSMGQNRVAGALRFDRLDSNDSSDDDDEEDDASGGGGGGDDGNDGGDGGSGGSAGSGESASKDTSPASATTPASAASPTSAAPPAPACGRSAVACDEPAPATRPSMRSRRGLLTFEFRDTADAERPTASSSTSSLPTTSTDSVGKDPKEPTDATDKDKSQKEKGVTSQAYDPHSDDDDRSVPAEVEFYLGKLRDSEACTSATMDWEGINGESEDEHSNEDETVEETSTSKDKDKRQKLDSGIGEETTPTSDSSPIKTDSKTDESDADGTRPSDSLTDEVEDVRIECRRRVQKRGRWSCGSRGRVPSDSSSGASGASAGGSGESPPGGVGGSGGTARRRCKRRANDNTPSPDARRVRLSILMKRGVKELPLPYALKKYVNFGRCFQF